MIELLLIRHGETAWNAEKRMQGHLDIALNSAGLQQAMALAYALRDEPLDAVISSDLLRARQTAEAIMTARAQASDNCTPLQIDPGLRERCFGIFEGLLYDELGTCHPHAYASWAVRELDARYPPGVNHAETLREFFTRAVATIDRLASHYDSSAGTRKIALITHGGVLECAYRAATGGSIRSHRDFDILNASVNRMRWSSGKLELVRWADVDHLTQSARDEIVR